jgi:hypothetical protein
MTGDGAGFGAESMEIHDHAQRDLYAARLVERDTTTRQRAARLVDGVVAAFSIAARKVMRAFDVGSAGQDMGAQAMGDAGGLTVSAVAGKLEGASLEGEIRRAEIARLFAEARKLNAEAEKIEVDTAGSRLEQVLQLANAMEVRVGLSRLPDGTPCITLGDGLGAEIPIPRLNTPESR